MPAIRVDVLVIGQGAAGLFAGISLGKDYSVAVVGNNASATSLSTGCISMISQEAESRSGGRIDLESMAHSVHPFSDIIERSAMNLETLLPEMSQLLFRALADQGLEMSDDLFHQHPLLTNLGTEYTCSSAPAHTINGQLDKMAGSKLAVLGIVGGLDLDPDLVRLLIDLKRLRLRSTTHWATTIKGLKGRRNCGPNEIAEVFRSEEAIEQLIGTIKELDEENVMIPPLFSLSNYASGMTALSRRSGRNVFEAVTPLSLPGLRLQGAMEKAAQAEGCRMLKGRTAVKLQIEDDVVTGAVLSSRTRRRLYHFNSLIIATGDVIGGGLAIKGREIVDPFDSLKVATFPPRSKKIAEPGIAEAVEETGYLVGNDMRLISKDGRTLRNAFGAGAALAGFSFPTGVGLGGSLLTAYVAAKSVQEVN
jgi:anaerobic glycerol-3-phosphate dehydrogenase B subunit